MPERDSYFEIICKSLKSDLCVTIVPLEGFEFGDYGVSCEISSGVSQEFILSREKLRAIMMDVFADNEGKVSAVFDNLDSYIAVNIVHRKDKRERLW